MIATLVRFLGPRKRFPTDQHVKEAVLVNSFYWTGRSPQRTFVLRTLEEDYRHGEPIDFSQAALTIEHVLPQSLTPDWEEILSAGASEGETPEDVHASLVHTLGNLTLTAYNAKLANDSFHAKKKLLADSGLAMNREIADTSGWGRPEIQARGRALGQRIMSIWPGPNESVSTPPPDPRWALMNQVLASLPAGRWTCYSDVGAVIGSHQVAVGARLATVTVPNAHRVLKLSGHISPDFRWPDPERTDDPREVLEAEGLRFDESGRADLEQRLTATDLAAAMESDTNAYYRVKPTSTSPVLRGRDGARRWAPSSGAGSHGSSLALREFVATGPVELLGGPLTHPVPAAARKCPRLRATRGPRRHRAAHRHQSASI